MTRAIKFTRDSILHSYSKVFFAENKLLGLILLFVSFFDWWAGLMGILSVVTVVVITRLLKYDYELTRNGAYGYNALLVGLGIGLYFAASWYIVFIVIAFAILTFFMTLAFQGLLTKYGLPYLSLPFLFSMWIVSLSIFSLSYLGVSERGIYIANNLYKIGGDTLVKLYYSLDSIDIPHFWRTYFLSMGAIFFQLSTLAGVLISLGLLIYSRIAFSLSVIGFAIAYLLFDLLHIDMTQLSYTYIGFNFILTSIAVGGYYIIPSKTSYLALFILMPVSVFIAIAGMKILQVFHVPLYSLPFNMIVLLYLYALKYRTDYTSAQLIEPLLPKATPEHTLYDFQNNLERFYSLNYFPVYLPVNGIWYIAQGHDGVYTHKGNWRHAWDFVQVDSNKQQFKGNGDYPEDYYCYGKTVIAPADGTVIEIIDGVEDNIIGQVNIKQNWGNCIVIQHTPYLYSLVAHLKKGSIKVKKGQAVKAGQPIAQVGNSGRSPYPHLHFQFQATPYVGSPTLDYPFAYYIKQVDGTFTLAKYSKPNEGDTVSNIITNDQLTKIFNFVPGRNLEVEIIESNIKLPKKLLWQIQTTPANIPYIYCTETGAKAYLQISDKIFYFTDYIGRKKTLLHYFYLSFYKIILSFYKNMEINDSVPIYQIYNQKLILRIQDFIAPFHLFTLGKFKMKYINQEIDFDDEKIVLESNIDLQIVHKKTVYLKSKIIIHNNHIDWIVTSDKIRIKAKII